MLLFAHTAHLGVHSDDAKIRKSSLNSGERFQQWIHREDGAQRVVIQFPQDQRRHSGKQSGHVSDYTARHGSSRVLIDFDTGEGADWSLKLGKLALVKHFVQVDLCEDEGAEILHP